MKKILYLASFDISKRTGGGLASLCYYNALCELYPNQVDLVLPEECCIGKYSNAIALPARKCLDYIKDFSLHRGKRYLFNFLEQNNNVYSTCVINSSRYGYDLIDRLHKYGIKVIMIHHNYEVEYCMENKYNITLWGKWPKLVSYVEGTAYRKSDINCFLTVEDKETIKAAYGKSKERDYLLGVFNPAHVEKRKDYTKEQIPSSLVITGSLSAYQTYESIKIFEQAIFPRFVASYPKINILISGRNPNECIWDFQARYPNNLGIIPNPDNIDDVVNRAQIFLCPTSIGGGLKLRIMDGLKNGLPVLTHEVSARGYDMFFDSPFFKVYSDSESFIRGYKELMQYIDSEPNYSKHIVDAYFEHFSFEAGVSRLRDIMNTIQ